MRCSQVTGLPQRTTPGSQAGALNGQVGDEPRQPCPLERSWPPRTLGLLSRGRPGHWRDRITDSVDQVSMGPRRSTVPPVAIRRAARSEWRSRTHVSDRPKEDRMRATLKEAL
jgi:hypothetical protein